MEMKSVLCKVYIVLKKKQNHTCKVLQNITKAKYFSYTNNILHWTNIGSLPSPLVFGFLQSGKLGLFVFFVCVHVHVDVLMCGCVS